MEAGGEPKAPPLAEELLAVDSCLERESFLSVEGGGHYQVAHILDNTTAMCIWTKLIGLLVIK